MRYGRGVSTLYTYFAAASDADAAVFADSETGPIADTHPVVDGVDPVVQGATLLSLLDGRDYDEIADDPAWARLVSSPDGDARWVVSLPDSFTTALADATDAQLTAVAVPWSETEEFWGAVSSDDLIPVLFALRALALSVRDTDARLYCWMSL